MIDGIGFRFIDTAGIRETKDVVESIGIKKTFEKIEQAQVVLYILDGSWMLEVGSLDAVKIEIEKIRNQFPLKPLIVVINKSDTLTNKQITECTQKLTTDNRQLSTDNRQLTTDNRQLTTDN